MNKIKFISSILFLFAIIIYAGEKDYLAFAEKMPEIKGGLKALYSKVEYPAQAKSKNVQGKVYVLIYISETGKVDNVKVVKGIGSGCDEAAINAIKKCEFNPGVLKGKPVKVKMALAIKFKLIN